jgi:hypothetical protein
MKLYHLFGPLQVFMYVQELNLLLMYVYVKIMSLSFELHRRVVIYTVSINW